MNFKVISRIIIVTMITVIARFAATSHEGNEWKFVKEEKYKSEEVKKPRWEGERNNRRKLGESSGKGAKGEEKRLESESE